MAAAAYTSCSKIYNDYDGLTHDYSRKGGLKYSRVFLPTHAPPEWTDRAVLWNAVETAEKTKNSRLAREIIVALPVELTLEQNIRLIEEYVQTQFVDDGMCADVSIHDTDGHNPPRAYSVDSSTAEGKRRMAVKDGKRIFVHQRRCRARLHRL